MRILHLGLTNFRNYSRLEVDLPPGIIVLQGDNAQGKTNLLEAIYYLSRMRSPRTSIDRELVNWLAMEDDLPFARLVAQIQRAEQTEQIELSLVQGNGNREHSDAATLRRHIRVNGTDKKILDAVGLLGVVLFMPQDIDLLGGPPHIRRRYLDDTVSQVVPQYFRELQQYNRVLAQRNYLLRSLGRQGDDSQLLFWDQRLVEHGAYLCIQRQRVVQQLDEVLQEIHLGLTDGKERLRLKYCASIDTELDAGAAYQIPLLAKGDIPALAEASLHGLSASFAEQLRQARPRELEQGVSTVGPHRDDLRFLANGVDLTIFGSRGQQRTATLSLKLAELEWLTAEKKDKPLLLLDDVASELDASHRDCLLKAINRSEQVVMTTTGLGHYERSFLEQATLWHVSAGRIEELTIS